MPRIIYNTEMVDISNLGVASEDKIEVLLHSKFTRNIERIEPALICQFGNTYHTMLTNYCATPSPKKP